MASIYESPDQQVMLTGSQTSPSFQPVQAYDPSRIMLAQSDRDLEALAQFSGTLGGILKKKGEEIKEETIGKGFTKFITGEIVFNPDTGEFNAKEEAVRTGARNATAIAEAAEGMPGEQGMSAQIRRTSPAIRGLEAMGASRAMAQNAPLSYNTFVRTAKNEGRVLIDPDTKAPIQLSPQMTWVEWERAERILLGQWGKETGYNRINPQVMMQYGAQNLAIARARLNEEFGAELDASAKFEAREKNKQTNLTAFASIKDPTSAAAALATIEQSSATSGAKQRNEDFIEDLTAAVTTLKSNKDIAKATLLLDSIEGIPHPSKVGTYGSRFRQTIQTLRDGLQDAGVAIEAQVVKEREAQFVKEADNANRFPQAKRDELLNGKDGIIPRARAAGISEEVITKMLTGGSSVTEQALLEGSRNDPNYFNRLGIDKIRIDQLETSNIIDKSVADQLRGNPNLKPGTDTSEARVKAAFPAAELTLISDMGGSYMTPGQPMTAAGADAQLTRQSALARAAEFLKPEIQAQIQANIPLNVTALGEKLAQQARSYLFNRNDPDYFNISTKTADNKDDKKQGVSITTNFTTNLTKDETKAIVDKIGGGVPQTPIGSFQLGSTDISNAQEAVNTGGKIPQYILNIAKSDGGPNVDINRYMREQAVNAGAPEWKPNQGQEAFLQEVRRVSPAYAKRFADPNLTPTERRNLLNQYRTLQSNIQIQADQSAVPAGNSLSVLQQAIVYEESRGDYGQYNFGISRTGPGNPAITNLKVKDVIRGDFAIDGQIVKHFGAYQFNPKTLAAVIKAAGISPDQPFNQATQDKAFQALVVGGALSWRNKLNDYMAGKVPDTTANLAAAMADMSTEWEGALKIPSLKLGQMLRNIRLEQTSVVDPKLSTLPGPARTVEVGKMLLARGIKIWQHPQFDLAKGFVSGGARVGSRGYDSFHNSNQALDLPVSHNTLTQLDATYDYLLKNAKALGVSEIYWDRKGYYRDGQMIGGPRSKAIADHDDHLHVSFK